MKRIFAMDIGGTSVKHAFVCADGSISRKNSVPTLAERGGASLLARVIELCRAAAREDDIEGISISTAGQVNPADGSICFATDNLPGWTGVKLKREVERTLGKPCAVVNDVNAAALGEGWLGAAIGVSDALMLTLGTGIGGAILMGGQLYLGKDGSAGEIGHLCLYPGGEPCTCGQRGCYERYASTRALERRAERLHLAPSATALFDAARLAPGPERLLIDEWMRDVAQGIASLVSVLDPEAVVLGGAVSAQGEAITIPLQTLVRERVMPSYRNIRVLPAQLGNAAGLLGSARSLLISGAR